jgi:AraC-like DNA-binding protein
LEIGDTFRKAGPVDGDWRGVLYPARLPTLHRMVPPAPVAGLVRWFWIPQWHLAPGRVSRQEIIAFPACNLAVEPELVGLAGPSTRRSFRDLTGRGWAVGALLRPAAVPHLVEDPAAIRDAYLPLDLPDLHAAVTTAMTSDHDGAVRRSRAVDAFVHWLADTMPAPDAEALLANAMADLIDADPTVLQVEQAAAHLGISVRTLQRLARHYVGLPPAAMIRRRRLQEAAERLRREPGIDIATVAHDLGYADHAHLTTDFRNVLNFTPSSYRGNTQRHKRREDGDRGDPFTDGGQPDPHR